MLTSVADVVNTTAETEAKVADTFVWERYWWPVRLLSDLDPSRPTPIELLGMQLVLWQDASGTWRCFHDSCPHRRVPLSEGRVEGGELVCSYHGWRFDQGGACTAIPQAPDAKSLAAATASPRSCATAFPTQETNRLLWVWPDSSPTAAADAAAAPLPRVNAQLQPEWAEQVNNSWFFRQMPYDWDVLMENVQDPSHVSFSHHASYPSINRHQAVPQPFRPLAAHEVEATEFDQMASGTAPVGAFNYPTQWHPNYRIMFHGGGLLTISGVGRHTNIAYAIPDGPGRSSLIIGHATDPTALRARPLANKLLNAVTPKFMEHIQRMHFFDGDSVFLNAQGSLLRRLEARTHGAGERGETRKAVWANAYFMPMSSDSAVVAARKWIDRHAGGGPAYAADAAPATGQVSRELLLDRLGQHTKHCVHCRRGLATAGHMVAAGRVLLAIAFFALCCLASSYGLPRLLAGGLPSVATAVAVVAGLAALRLQAAGEWLQQQLTFVDYVHADIP